MRLTLERHTGSNFSTFKTNSTSRAHIFLRSLVFKFDDGFDAGLPYRYWFTLVSAVVRGIDQISVGALNYRN